MTRPLIPLVTFALTACVVVAGPDDTTPVRDLVAARARWNLNGPASYAVTQRLKCFCVLGGAEVRVLVDRGAVVSAIVIATGQPVPDPYLPGYRTVEQLFDLLEDAMERRAHRIEARYDTQLGYPSDFYIDYSANIADEEVGYDLLALTPR